MFCDRTIYMKSPKMTSALVLEAFLKSSTKLSSGDVSFDKKVRRYERGGFRLLDRATIFVTLYSLEKDLVNAEKTVII